VRRCSAEVEIGKMDKLLAAADTRYDPASAGKGSAIAGGAPAAAAAAGAGAGAGTA
jgi:hypothetical protein